jgi:NADH-quinone oxidoreductase subunit C
VDASPRFTGIYHLYSSQQLTYVRVAVECAGPAEAPVLPSLCELYPAANWHERETYDLLGIRYEGHPDLRRILMWEGYAYHPLRKDFPLAGIDVELPEADSDVVAATEQGINPTSAPMMGGPFVAPQTSTMAKREPRAQDESWSEKSPKARSKQKDA